MLLKYSLNNIKRERRLLDMLKCDVTVNERNFVLTVTTKTPHGLRTHDSILIKHAIQTVEKYNEANDYLINGTSDIVFIQKQETVIEKNIKGDDVSITYTPGYYWKDKDRIQKIPQDLLSDVLNKYTSFNDKLVIICDDICKFTVTIPRYKTLHVSSVFDSDNVGFFKTKGELPILLHNGDTVTFNRKVYSYEYNRTVELTDNFIKVEKNPNHSNDYLGSDMIIFNGNVYEWKSKDEEIECVYIDEHTFSYQYEKCIVSENEILEIEDRRFITNTNLLYDTVLLYEYNEYININLPVSETNATELNNEDLAKTYFEECKQSLISNINDYEKRCFIPYYNDVKQNKLMPVSNIRFNLYLRDRKDNTDWNTSDIQGWNQYPIDINGNFIKPDNTNITNGDLLCYLGFTDEDVYYRRKKIEKTFLRLSFYNSNDPFTQMLLFYSTIFLDSGEFYIKYINNFNNPDCDKDKPIIAQNIFGDNNLTLSFNVSDRYNRNKSSEGFYLYLFPDGINDDTEREIYMKAELHHAGNGKTIPLMYPCDSDSKPLDFKNSKFPTHLLTDDGDLTNLYKHMFVPVKIKYDTKKNDYIYFFRNPNYEKEKQVITLGLYEPKINPIT